MSCRTSSTATLSGCRRERTPPRSSRQKSRKRQSRTTPTHCRSSRRRSCDASRVAWGAQRRATYRQSCRASRARLSGCATWRSLFDRPPHELQARADISPDSGWLEVSFAHFGSQAKRNRALRGRRPHHRGLVCPPAELSGYFYEYDNHKIAVFTLYTSMRRRVPNGPPVRRGREREFAFSEVATTR